MSPPLRIGIAITRAASIDATWTTVHLARAALDRGHSVRFIEPWDFEIDAARRIIARSHAFDPPTASAEAIAAALAERVAPRRFVDVERLDLLMLRAAPLDPAVLTFAAIAQDCGVRVVNDPAGALRVSHKSWLAAQKGAVTPATLVTRSAGAAHTFFQTQPTGVVVKPARGSGGRGVARVLAREADVLDAAFVDARDHGDGYVVLQAYLHEAEAGEKRVVWLDGEVIGGYLRRRAPNDFRHNLSRGGVAEPTEITPADHAAIASLSAPLLRAGIRLVGFDLIGGAITEVNALNPGGAFHADRLTAGRLGERIIAALEHPAPLAPDLSPTPVPSRTPENAPSEPESNAWASPAR
jgi:glutathione synthase